MSWLSQGLKKIEHGIANNPITKGSRKLLKGAENWIANRIPHVSVAEKNASMQAAKEQIDYYQKAKQDLETARTESENQKKAERQRINEKEIKARKATYRRAGFLEEPATKPKETLG